MTTQPSAHAMAVLAIHSAPDGICRGCLDTGHLAGPHCPESRRARAALLHNIAARQRVT